MHIGEYSSHLYPVSFDAIALQVTVVRRHNPIVEGYHRQFRQTDPYHNQRAQIKPKHHRRQRDQFWAAFFPIASQTAQVSALPMHKRGGGLDDTLVEGQSPARARSASTPPTVRGHAKTHPR